MNGGVSFVRPLLVHQIESGTATARLDGEALRCCPRSLSPAPGGALLASSSATLTLDQPVRRRRRCILDMWKGLQQPLAGADAAAGTSPRRPGRRAACPRTGKPISSPAAHGTATAGCSTCTARRTSLKPAATGDAVLATAAATLAELQSAPPGRHSYGLGLCPLLRAPTLTATS